jgi:hypothetical protein
MNKKNGNVYKPPYKGKPPVTDYTDEGLPVIVVHPTPSDLNWKFSNGQHENQDGFIDAIMKRHDGTDKTKRDPSDRPLDCDSHEISIHCFEGNGWPERTDLRCWWCLHQFDNRPFPCPSSMKSDGTLSIRGVFCGPSCAKSWAFSSNIFSNLGNIEYMINLLAQKRGYCREGKKTVYIPAAPPRESLDIFCGPDGMNIKQFREMCACGFDVNVLYPPIITEKQVIVAECERLQRATNHGRITHVDTLDNMMMSAMDCARQRRDGMKIFAGVGVRRLSDYKNNIETVEPYNITSTVKGPRPNAKERHCPRDEKNEEGKGEEKRLKTNAVDSKKQCTVTICGADTSSHRGKIKRPLPRIEPIAFNPPKKRKL